MSKKTAIEETDETDETKTKARRPRVVAPEIVEARQQCEAIRESAEARCEEIMVAARQAAKVRRLTEGMTDEQRELLKKSL